MALVSPVDTSPNKSPSSEKPEGAEGVEKRNYLEKNKNKNKSEQEQYTVFRGRVFRDGSWIV